MTDLSDISGRRPLGLGSPPPRALANARLELHHAAQLVASVGKTLLPPEEDDSHPNLGWDPVVRALAGHLVPGARPFRAALRPDGFALSLLDARGQEVEEHTLAGKTLASASNWLAEAIRRHFEHPLADGLVSPGYSLPAHAVGEGKAFSASAEDVAALGRWFALAHTALERVQSRTSDASAVRCWPHHFDLATLVALERGPDGAATRTVGLGLSPGDDGYPEPYAYGTPWPYPEPAQSLPELPSGHWHRESYTAAILLGTELVATEDAGDALEAFLDGAFAACRSIHGL